jgi:hypothetical protein
MGPVRMAELEDNIEPDDSPFSSENAPGLNLIVNMRIYDVLMGLYMEQAPEKATALMEMHAEGKILTALPSYIPED